MNETLYVDSPIGPLRITIERQCVTAITVAPCHTDEEPPRGCFALHVKKEIGRYFAGEATELDFPVRMNGTPFQVRVWEELRKIPYGSIATYGNIAGRIGSPKAARAVGMACNRNPLLLAVPCHRVVGSGGKMTGFAVGIERKEYLLRLERGSDKKSCF